MPKKCHTSNPRSRFSKKTEFKILLLLLVLFKSTNALCDINKSLKELSQQLSALDRAIVDAQEMDRRIHDLEDRLEEIKNQQQAIAAKIVAVRKNLPDQNILQFANQDNEWIKQLNTYNAQEEELRKEYKNVDDEFGRLKNIRSQSQKSGKIRRDN